MPRNRAKNMPCCSGQMGNPWKRNSDTWLCFSLLMLFLPQLGIGESEKCQWTCHVIIVMSSVLGKVLHFATLPVFLLIIGEWISLSNSGSNNTSTTHINQVFSQRNQWTFSLHSINNYWTTAFSHIEYIVYRTEKSLCSSLHLYIKPGSNLYNLIGWKLEKGTRWMLSIIPFLLKRVWNSLHLKRVTETMSWGFNRVCCTLPVLSHLKSPVIKNVQSKLPNQCQ